MEHTKYNPQDRASAFALCTGPREYTAWLTWQFEGCQIRIGPRQQGLWQTCPGRARGTEHLGQEAGHSTGQFRASTTPVSKSTGTKPLWNLELSRLAQETGIDIEVHHFPPGSLYCTRDKSMSGIKERGVLFAAWGGQLGACAIARFCTIQQ